MTAPTTEQPNSGEPMDIADVLAQLTDISPAHVDAGITAVLGRINELRAKAKSDGLTDGELAEVKQRRAEWDQLTAEKARRDEAQAEMDAAFDGIPEDTTEQGDEPQAEATDDTVTEQAEEAPAEEKTPEPVAASATEAPKRLPLGTVTRDREPTPATSTTAPTGAKASLVAAAGDRNHAAGSQLSDGDLYQAIWDRQRRLGSSRGGTGDDWIPVASLEHPKDPTRHLDPQAVTLNDQKIAAVTAPTALTAAGVCAPYTIDYSMGVIGTSARPVRDAFPAYTADRGGVQFRRDVDALGNGPISATGTWSLSTDATPGGNTKPIWEVPCNSVVSAEVTAVTLGLKFSNITNMYDPEAVAANTQAASIAHARYAEQLLLNSMYAQCTATFQETKRLGATRDLLVAIDKVRAYWRDARRIGDDVPLRVVLPHWVLDAMRADLTRALHTSNADFLGEPDNTILGWFSRRGITPSWTLDGRAAQVAAGSGSTQTYVMAAQNYAVQSGSQTIPGFPDQVEFAMFPEGTFVYLDGGQLDVGVVRDTALVQTNRYIQFQETFEGLYRKGIEAVRVVADVAPMGASAGTRDTTAYAD